MSRYTSATESDRSEMLREIGVESIEELFADIPAHLRLAGPLELDPGQSELEVFQELRALAARNTSTEDELCFLGAGMYDHYVPALVDSITSRSEFLTPYTPYQPEVSQGGLQAMFEYQTAICELTGLPVSNASVYEGPERGRRRRLRGQAGQPRAVAVHRLARPASSFPRGAGDPGPRLGDGGGGRTAARRPHRPAGA